MAQQRLSLTSEQVVELEQVRDHAELPYQRERAAALLKIAGGLSATAVAQHGLLRPRRRHTVVGWVKRYRAEGVAGLGIRPGRGRKAAFSPPDGG